MKNWVQSLVLALTLVASACGGDGAGGAVSTRADVTVSDGRTYVIETYYAGTNDAGVRQTRPSGEINVSAIDGDSAWTTGSDEDGGDMLRTVVLGHQFHALVLHFDAIVRDVRDVEMQFGGETRRAREGAWPFGEGTARMVSAPSSDQTEALLFNFAGVPEITVTLSDWRDADGGRLPYHLSINDGARTFEYAFTEIERGAEKPTWMERDASTE